jgi:D-alanyl-D-alanine carboxypeptidase/D-alanyl-D-alanine-endopeptidase (penicillin-binding protein 4)
MAKTFKVLSSTFVAALLISGIGVVTPSFAEPGDGSEVEVVSCKATKAMEKSTLGKFHAYVINVDTGKVVIDINGTELTPSASVMKTLTAVAALQKLPEDYRASTQVLRVPEEPGTLVLKGGGDYTLSRLAVGQYSTYSKPAKLRNLVKTTLAALPVDGLINKIILDSTFFEGPSWNPDWLPSYRTLGYVSHITALQADGDRLNPDLTSTSYSFRRGIDPVTKTGKLFRTGLGEVASGAEIVIAETPATAEVIAEVFAQPLRAVWLDHMLTYSDNTGSEFIARHAAKAAGIEPSILGTSKVIKQSLREIGLKPKALVIRDASGLSDNNRLNAKFMAELMAKVAKDENGLGLLKQWMPVAGESGTLKYRFQGTSAIARGQVIAKTGYIPGLYGLSGIVTAEDGSTLAFTVFARADPENGKSVTYTAQGAIDKVVTRFYLCGANLSQ